jgi:hypothetical protein
MPDENDIRTALRVLAEEAPEPGTVLTAVLTRAPTRSTHGRAARRRRWAAPLGAAAAVAAVAVAATSIAIGTGVAPSADAHANGLPPYYVALYSPASGGPTVTTVRDIRTGAVLATVHPPRGSWFAYATAGANDDSFLLGTGPHDGLIELYLLRFNPADRGTSLTRLIRVPIPGRQAAASLAMSPNGAEVAVSTTATDMTAKLRIYSLSGRLIRIWQEPGLILSSLSWAASGYLAFNWFGGPISVSGIRIIWPSAVDGSLVGASRLLVPSQTAPPMNFAVSGDGTSIAAIANVPVGHSGEVTVRVEKFSVTTGKVTGTFPGRSLAFKSVWWSNRTGSALIVSTQTVRGTYGILTRRGFTPLPLAQGWATFAF